MNTFDKNHYKKPAKKFKALGHPIRLWIAEQLLEEEHCVRELVERTEFDFSTISQHLNALKEAEVVEDEKRGKQVFYHLSCECVKKFLACVAEHRKNGVCPRENKKKKEEE